MYLNMNGRGVPCSLIGKVYWCSPLCIGGLKTSNEMCEELILCGKVIDHKLIRVFMDNWGCKAPLPDYLLNPEPGYSYFGLGALLGHRIPIRNDIEQTLLNSLSRHRPEVIRALWSLARKMGKAEDYYQNTWAFLKEYGVTFDEARETGLLVTTSHRVALWPDPELKGVLSQVDPSTILWMSVDMKLGKERLALGTPVPH